MPVVTSSSDLGGGALGGGAKDPMTIEAINAIFNFHRAWITDSRCPQKVAGGGESLIFNLELRPHDNS